MSIWDDFVAATSQKVEKGLEQVAPIGGDANTPPDIGGAISDAIYQYGRGRVDTAVQNLTSAFRKTATGKQVEADATTQRIQELMPYIFGGVALLFGAFLYLRTR
jgi:hypothetical protein